MRLLYPTVMLLSLMILLSGCNPLARDYRPMSELEKRVFHIADRNIHPDDVRNAPEKYKDTMVAWPGVVVEREFIERMGRTEVQFVLKHHYYDWVEDMSFDDERLLLSRRGEGSFKATWRIRSKSKLRKIETASDPGSLLIVYGRPESVNEDGSINLATKYLRVFSNKWYRSDKLDYGRPDLPDKKTEPMQTSALK